MIKVFQGWDRDRLDLMRATTAHVRASRGGEEASNEATVLTADLHLLGRLAGGLILLLGDVDVAVAERREGRGTARLVGESDVIRTGGDGADGGGCASGAWCDARGARAEGGVGLCVGEGRDIAHGWWGVGSSCSGRKLTGLEVHV